MTPEFRDAWNFSQDDYTHHKQYRKDAPKNYERIQVGDVVLFAEKDKKLENKYDHLHEQHSIIVPGENAAWTQPQLEKSNEVKWHEETIKQV